MLSHPAVACAALPQYPHILVSSRPFAPPEGPLGPLDDTGVPLPDAEIETDGESDGRFPKDIEDGGREIDAAELLADSSTSSISTFLYPVNCGRSSSLSTLPSV